MILPERVLGRPGGPVDDVRCGDRADFLADVLDEFLLQVVGVFLALFEGDVGVDALSLDVVGEADDGGLGDFGVRD